jgi:hypothetical protein
LPSVTATTTARTVTLRAAPAPTHCTDYLYGHSALVTFSSRTVEVSPVCRSWISVNAKEGQHWIEAADGQAPMPTGLRTVCTLDTRKGRITAVVEARLGEIFGRAACAGLRSAGWTERKSS